MIKSKRLVSAKGESESVDDGVSPAGCKHTLSCLQKRQGHNNKSISKEESYAIQP